MRSLILLLLVANLYCNERQAIADAIINVSKQSGLDRSIYYTLINIESNFNPYSVGIVGSEKLLQKIKESNLFDVKASKYGQNYLISITGSKEDILALSEALYEFDINFDMGLMQISRQHVKKDELKQIFDFEYNIAKGSNILRSCVDKFNATQEIIECYNRGFNVGKSKKYYEVFVKNYNRNFHEK
jgi:soluble lytic murein transglycosylase-like protein